MTYGTKDISFLIKKNFIFAIAHSIYPPIPVSLYGEVWKSDIERLAITLSWF